MEYGEGKMVPGSRVELSEPQKRARKFRNIAIGLCLFALVATFYVATMIKLDPKMLARPEITLDVK